MEARFLLISKKPIRYQYGPDPNQFGDLYRTDDPNIAPVIVVIHGGYWKDNHNLNSYATAAIVNHLAASGRVAVWNLEYRRMNQRGVNVTAPWPAPLVDIADGIDFLRCISQQHNLDLSDLFVIGHSAGGHLAAWSGCRPDIPRANVLYRERPLIPVRIISIGGILDLRQFGELSQPEQVVRMLGGREHLNTERRRFSNPAELQLAGGTELIAVHGEADLDVPVDQSKSFAAGGNAANVELYLFKDVDHFGMLPLDGVFPKAWADMLEILARSTQF